ncbi:hypothetical protein V9T40_007047 [Parthenolecanium corni]|uniref:Uncharacterized protein n=1 Tax=Parthenolecanium corni TaxID=536013 RepID=A0AAN9U352_9HEMI
MQSLKIVAVLLVACITYASAGAGSLLVRNSGGYIATCNVEYDLSGQRKSNSCGDFSLGVNKEIQIPAEAKNIFLKVEEYWFPGSKTTIFTKTFSDPVQKCFKIWGTTLDPKYDEVAC